MVKSVTFQAVSNGVHAITYDNEKQWRSKFYHWLDKPDPVKNRQITFWQNEGRHVMISWVISGRICGSISMVWFKPPLPALQLDVFSAGENLLNFMFFMGKELQPSYEPCLLSK